MLSSVIVVVIMAPLTIAFVRSHPRHLEQPWPLPPANGQWTTTPDLAAPGNVLNADAAAVWTGSEVVVVGAFVTVEATGDPANAGSLGESAAFSPSTNAWRTLPSPPIDSAWIAAAWTGHEVFAFGYVHSAVGPDDFRGRFVTLTGFAMDPTVGKWRALSPAPPRAAAGFGGAAAVGSDVILAARDGSYLAYHPASDKWDTLPASGGAGGGDASLAPVPTPGGFVAVRTDTSDAVGPTSTVVSFDASAGSWHDLPSASSRPDVLATSGSLVVSLDGDSLNVFDIDHPDAPLEGGPIWPSDLHTSPDTAISATSPDALFVWGQGAARSATDVPVVLPTLDGAMFDLESWIWRRMPELPGDPQEHTQGWGIWAGDRVFTWWGGGTTSAPVLRGAWWIPG